MYSDARSAGGSLADVDVVLAGQLRNRSSAPHRVPSGGHDANESLTGVLTPFEVLFEAELPDYQLPEELNRLYGRLGFPDRVVYSNFVWSLDGVVSLGSEASGRFG